MPAVAAGLRLHLGGFDAQCPYQAVLWSSTFFRRKARAAVPFGMAAFLANGCPGKRSVVRLWGVPDKKAEKMTRKGGGKL